MVRSFLPVGQGVFYCECFEKKGSNDNINIVYDCGTLTDVKIVENEIRNNFHKGEKIEALFISHLDEDHINGIPFLLTYCNVKRIYFPIFTLKIRKLMEIYYHVNNIGGFTFDFFMDPYGAVRNVSQDDTTEVIGIDEEGEEFSASQERIGYQRSGDDVFGGIKGKEEIDDLYDRWLYIPFNYWQNKRVGILLDNLRDQFGRAIIEEELVEIWRNNAQGDRSKIKQSYQDVPGDFNTNTMVLFSGETDGALRQYTYGGYAKYCSLRHIKKRSGCLYMGDYEA